MSIWFLLWLCLSVFLLYFLGWTLYILLKQKQAWKSYALKKQLRYRAKNVFSAPEIMGTVDGYTLHMFTGEHAARDARNVRKLTAIEINLVSKMPVDMTVASGGMVDIAHEIGFKEEYRPEHELWSEQYIAASPSIPVLKAYLTPPRMEALGSLMKIKNAWVIVVLKGSLAFLRLDTPSALEDPRKIDALVNRLVKAATILELKAGEEQVIKTEAAKTIRQKTIHAPQNKNTGVNLELEEETPPTGETPE
ncbi:MAG: hypothetical protein ACT4OY_07860 [Alphaproteobacteria bacterium]